MRAYDRTLRNKHVRPSGLQTAMEWTCATYACCVTLQNNNNNNTLVMQDNNNNVIYM